MKDYYEDYWSRKAPPPTTDLISDRRLAVLQSTISDAYGPLDQIGRPLKLLDCGSGTGEAVCRFEAAGLDAKGMDISERAVQNAKQQYPHLEFFQGSVEENPWPVDPQSLDIVIALEVIEHLLRPRRLLANAYDVLKPGGHIALSCPYHGLLKNVAISVLAFDKHFDCEGDHIRFFSQRSLGHLLQEVGLVPRKWVRFGRAWGVWSQMFVWAQKPSVSAQASRS